MYYGIEYMLPIVLSIYSTSTICNNINNMIRIVLNIYSSNTICIMEYMYVTYCTEYIKH